MAQQGYFSCICCGRLYKEDGSEEDLFTEDHTPEANLQDD